MKLDRICCAGLQLLPAPRMLPFECKDNFWEMGKPSRPLQPCFCVELIA